MTSAGLNHTPFRLWGQVDNRSTSRGGFYLSQEFQMGGRFVAGAYHGLQKRLPEYGGWLFQRNAVATGQVSGDSLIANFSLVSGVQLALRIAGRGHIRATAVPDILFREPTKKKWRFR